MILRGAISPGERLNELRFTREFSLSRSPIREAFRMLASEGLITIRPRSGAWVKPISLEELEDVFEMRTLFETFAITRAAERGASGQLQIMRRLLREAVAVLEQRDIEAWYESAQSFHDAIIAAAGNQQLKALYDLIKLAMRRYQLLVIGLAQHPDRSQVEHQRILDAFVRGNSERASELLRAHLKRVTDTLAAALRESHGGGDSQKRIRSSSDDRRDRVLRHPPASL
jgi:DNA-binding GntR family transcriptional regulator